MKDLCLGARNIPNICVCLLNASKLFFFCFFKYIFVFPFLNVFSHGHSSTEIARKIPLNFYWANLNVIIVIIIIITLYIYSLRLASLPSFWRQFLICGWLFYLFVTKTLLAKYCVWLIHCVNRNSTNKKSQNVFFFYFFFFFDSHLIEKRLWSKAYLNFRCEVLNTMAPKRQEKFSLYS